MKINNKGFAITSIMYIILLFAVILIALTLALLSSRKLILDKIKSEVADSVNNTCVLVDGPANTIGSKYECEVKPGTKYNFYVLSYSDENGNVTDDITKAVTTNLIMDRNMCDDGTPATEDNTCLVAWNTSGHSSNGPVTAMTYLYNATKTWTNVPPLNYEYKDKEWQESVGVTFSDESGYESFISVDGIGKINGTKFTEEEPLRARMPYKSEVNGAGCEDYSELTCPLWMVEYLRDGGENFGVDYQQHPLKNVHGYWTSSVYSNDSDYAWFVYFVGFVHYFYVANDDNLGVRPVINLKL